jgi:hypothetical protein
MKNKIDYESIVSLPVENKHKKINKILKIVWLIFILLLPFMCLVSMNK